MAKKPIISEDPSTEEKIKAAAKRVFTKKGFAAARTRDIAEEAGINLALLNYYFRSKEKLFDIVIGENMQQFLMGVKGILSNSETSLQQKITELVANYIDMLKAHPDLPIFILSEVRANPEKFADKMGITDMILTSYFFIQVKEQLGPKVNPIHIFINVLALTIFPFIASPLLKKAGHMSPPDFDALMEQRKTLIPMWLESMMQVK